MNFLLSLLVLTSPPTLDDTQVKNLLQVIAPQPGEEAWEQIRWHTNLGGARRAAAAAGKPVLLWEMDGHPLGCT